MRHTFIPPLTAIPFMEVHNSGSMYYHYHHVQPGYPELEINNVLFISMDNVYSEIIFK